MSYHLFDYSIVGHRQRILFARE